MRTDFNSVAADAVLGLHAAFVLFVVVGQALIVIGWWRGWRWTRCPWFRVTHLAAIGFVMLETWLGIPCPLTLLENELRERAGQMYQTSFVAHWAQELLYYSAPAWTFTTLYTVFAFVVVACFVLYPPQRNPGCKDRSN